MAEKEVSAINTAGKKVSNLRINTIFLSMALFWSVIIVALAGWEYWVSYRSTIETARSSAYELGKKLALTDPASMTRQAHELGNKEYGKIGHITSLKPSRPENAPDDWEKRALQALERGQKEVSSLEPLGKETYLRHMRPLITEVGCLQCHAAQGYKIGDIRGGISIDLLWEPFRTALLAQLVVIFLAYGGIWVLGILGLLFVWKQMKNHLSERGQRETALQESHAKLERNLKGSIAVISEMIEKKGACAPGHHRRVAALASAIAQEMKLTDFQVQAIGLAAAVYDIGLIDIPAEFIQDTTRLEGLKLAMYQGYPQAGHDALKKIESPWPITEIILQHRECFDGSGFPRGLKGETILIEARILAVVDALEDLTSNKIHRPALPREEALAAIENHRDSKYDPNVVAVCLKLFNEKGYKMES